MAGIDNGVICEQMIRKLGLIPHPEGGCFLETYRSGAQPMKNKGRTDPNGRTVSTANLPNWNSEEERQVMTSIYYLFRKSTNPVLRWIINKSDTVHYWQGGSSVLFHVLSPTGTYTTTRLGGRLDDILSKDAKPQISVDGGYWKAAELEGDYCLTGEAVAPGFDYKDFCWGTKEHLFNLVGDDMGKKLEFLLTDDPSYDFDRFYDP